MMESNEHYSVLLLDSYFDFCYSRTIVDVMFDVMKNKCSGCVRGDLSQLYHSCMSMSTEQRLKYHFEDILQEIDENEIIVKWQTAVSIIDGISPGLINMYKLRIGCRDWRATGMKTPEWKSRMIRMVMNLLHIEKRFF